MLKEEALNGLLKGEFITISKGADVYEIDDGDVVTKRKKALLFKNMREEGWSAYKRKDWKTVIPEKGILVSHMGDITKMSVCYKYIENDDTVFISNIESPVAATDKDGKDIYIPVKLSDISHLLLNEASLGSCSVTDFIMEEE